MAEINSKATIELQCNGQQVSNTLQQLRQRAFDLQNAIAKAAAAGNKTDLKKLERQLRDTNRQIRQMTSDAEQAELVLRRMSKATPKELSQTLATLQKQLKGIERGSEAWNAQVTKIKAVKAELAAVNAELREGQTTLQRFNSTFNEWQNAVMMGVAALTGLIMAGRKAVNAFAEMDAEMANTRKFTGMTAEEVQQLNEKFKQLDTRTSRDQLNLLAQEAGRLGKTSEEDVMGYVRAADILNVALSDLGAEATQTIAKLTNIFGDEQIYGTEQALLKVGSVVNVLSQNCTASKPYLTEFAQRLAGVGAQAGLTVPQIMAFGAVLDSQGQKVEMSATAISKLITDMFKNTSKLCKATGMDVVEFSDTLKRSTNEALVMLLETLNKKGDMSVLSSVFKDMGEDGARATQVLATLAGNIETVKRQQVVANEAFAQGTSVGREFDIQNNTVAAGLDKARKRAAEIAIELGEKLAPVMRHVISSGTLMLKFLSALVTFLIKHKTAIVSVMAAVVTYTIAVNASTIAAKASAAAHVLLNGVLKTGTAIVGAARTAALLLKAGWIMLTESSTRAYRAQVALNAAMKANPIGLLVGAVAGLVAAFMSWRDSMKAAKEQEEELRRKNEEFRKSILDIDEASANYAASETARLQALYDAAIDEAKSTDERKKAAPRLIDLYPTYFEKMSIEDVMLGKAKTAYDNLTEAIINSARARAAAAKIEENQGKLLELEAKQPALQQKVDNASRTYNQSFAKDLEESTTNKTGTLFEMTFKSTSGTITSKATRDARKNLEAAQAELAEVNRQIEAINAANKELAEKYKAVEILASPDSGGNMTGGSTDDGGKNKDKEADKQHRADVKQVQDWRATQEAQAEVLYYTGQTNYEQYQQSLLEIQKEYAEKMLALTDLTDKERAEAQAEYAKADFQLQKQYTEAEAKQLEESNREQKAIIMQRYADGLMEHETYTEAMQQLELRHLSNLALIYKEGSEERRKAQAAYDKALMDDQVKRRKKAEDEEKKAAEQHQKELRKIRKEAFQNTAADNDAEYQREKALLEEAYRDELKACKDNAKRKLEIEKAYQIALYTLQKKWMKKGSKLAQKEIPKSMKTAIETSVDWLNSDGGRAVTESFSTIIEGMSDIFTGISALIQANLDLETAAIEARYKTEVRAAEGNMYKVRQIEDKKEKDIAAAKNKANKKMFAMQVIQAIAQTATAALNAYSSAASIPYVGWIMAPIAAGLATAAGMLQVAAIKKQQQASEATGYSKGGFTKPGRKDEPAGIVHAGEWVASQELLASPVARPMIDALDYAQRTNTIGSLRNEDVVSPAAIATRSMANASMQPPRITVNPAPVTVQLDERLARTLARLQERLDEPFVTVNTVTGDTGIGRAQEEYSLLMRNNTPKSRRK